MGQIPVANTLPKFIKIGHSRSSFLVIKFLFAAAVLLMCLAKGGDFQGEKVVHENRFLAASNAEVGVRIITKIDKLQ